MTFTPLRRNSKSLCAPFRSLVALLMWAQISNSIMAASCSCAMWKVWIPWPSAWRDACPASFNSQGGTAVCRHPPQWGCTSLLPSLMIKCEGDHHTETLPPILRTVQAHAGILKSNHDRGDERNDGPAVSPDVSPAGKKKTHLLSRCSPPCLFPLDR